MPRAGIQADEPNVRQYQVRGITGNGRFLTWTNLGPPTDLAGKYEKGNMQGLLHEVIPLHFS